MAFFRNLFELNFGGANADGRDLDKPVKKPINLFGYRNEPGHPLFETYQRIKQKGLSIGDEIDVTLSNLQQRSQYLYYKNYQALLTLDAFWRQLMPIQAFPRN